MLNGMYDSIKSLSIPLIPVDIDSEDMAYMQYQGDFDDFVMCIKQVKPSALFVYVLKHSDLDETVQNESPPETIESLMVVMSVDGVMVGWGQASDYFVALADAVEASEAAEAETQAELEAELEELEAKLFVQFRDDPALHKIRSDDGRMLYIDEKVPEEIREKCWEFLRKMVKDIRIYKEVQKANAMSG